MPGLEFNRDSKMNKTINEASLIKQNLNGVWRSLLYALLITPIFAAAMVYLFWNGTIGQTSTSGLPAITREISQKTLEEQFCVRMRLIGITASGGIIDVRYKVIDKEKAKFLLDSGNQISLLLEDGTFLTPDTSGHKMKHNDRLEDGMIYFHMYPNTKNIVKPGMKVSVIFGSIRLESIAAQ